MRAMKMTVRACLATGVLLLGTAGAAGAAPVPLDQAGSPGSAAGQLSSPQGIDIDAAGDIYVADGSNHRISQFSADGSFVRAFGFGVDTGSPSTFEVCTTASTCQMGVGGAAAGQLFLPSGVALDGAGNLFVVSANNNRVDQFSLAGPSFVKAFGYDVAGGAAFESCTTISGCQAGISGGAAGQLASPTRIAVGPAGSLLVADTGNDRVSAFAPGAPAFLGAFGWGVSTGGAMFETCLATCLSGLQGTGAGQLANPNGVTADAGGSAFVSDTTNHRISRFALTPSPSFTQAFGDGVLTGAAGFEVCSASCITGSPGGAAGQLNLPAGEGLDAAGNLYVADAPNHRISQFSVAGPSFTQAFGFGVDTGSSTFEVCTTASTCEPGTAGNAAGQLDLPVGVAVDLCDAVWVSELNNGRLQRFGEPGTQPVPPCTLAAAPPPTPSNVFSFGKVKLNKKKGTATLKVEAPGPGQLQVSGKGLKGVSGRASAVAAAGTVKLNVKAKGSTAKSLKKKRKRKVTAKVTFTPDGGSSSTKSKKVTLKLK